MIENMTTTGGTAEQYEAGTKTKPPFVLPEQVLELARRYPTPFYLYDEKGLLTRTRALQEAFSWNPGFKEYFAVKALPNPEIIALLHEAGCGCDCANALELLIAQAAGVTGCDLVLSSNDTTDADFRTAASAKALITLDAAELVYDLHRILGCAMPSEVLLRFNPGGTFVSADAAHFAGDPEHSKFGMSASQLVFAAQRLGAYGLHRIGIHALLASNAQGNDYYPALSRLLFDMAVNLHRKTGLRIGHIDLSGGVGIAYDPLDSPPDIYAIGTGVRRAYEDILVPAGLGDVKLMCELGRWIAGPCGILVTRVLHEKKSYRDYLGVDACAANLLRPAIYGAYHHITVVPPAHSGRAWNDVATHRYSVTGGLCENNDQFAVDRMLPETHVGDLLLIQDAGAHAHSMGYNYNARLRCAEILLHANGTVDEIRRSETPRDYFATLDKTRWWPRLIATISKE